MSGSKITYGGQAVVEGVMMRGLRYFSVACRRASGEIEVRTEAVPAFFTRFKAARWPFLRGVFALADALVLGMKSLLYSANLAAADIETAGAASDPDDKDRIPPAVSALLGPLQLMLATGGGSVSGIAVTGSAVAGMMLGIGLFMLFPSVVAGLFRPVVSSGVALALIEGVVRVALVIGYIALVGRMASTRRVFQYHGAEHKAINALEQTGDLEIDTVMKASRIHPRCGTNFVLTVLMVKLVLFTLIPFQADLWARLGLRLLLLPAVASVSYEVIRLAGRYRDFPPLQWLVAPGLATQLLTTREPDRGMVEVAVTALNAVRAEEEALPAPPAVAAPALA